MMTAAEALSVAIEACMNVEVPRVPRCGDAALVLRTLRDRLKEEGEFREAALDYLSINQDSRVPHENNLTEARAWLNLLAAWRALRAKGEGP